jgi:hypothetical protein
MKRLTLALTGLILIGVGMISLPARNGKTPPLIAPALAAAAPQMPPLGPCVPPFQMTGSAEETAWRIWVAATCPINSNQYPYVVWENWIEQLQMYPAGGQGLAREAAPHQLHGSPLAQVIEARKAGKQVLQLAPNQQCGKPQNPPPNQPNLILCEEVRLDGSAQDYISANGLWNRPGQTKFAQAGGPFQFPWPSVEIKADWIQLSTCSNPPQGIHVEKIGSTCYALAGMHLISKLLNNWLWATFEPQNSSTNPFRCQVLGCNDPWGSNPAMTHGADTQLTAALAQLMKQANLAPEWQNYRLDGVQTEFVDSSGKPTLLGNSIIEGENAGVPLTQASCITCHDVSSIKTDGTDGITLLTSNPVGNPAPLPDNTWLRRDFVWSLALACPQGIQNCSSSLGGHVEKRKKMKTK